MHFICKNTVPTAQPIINIRLGPDFILSLVLLGACLYCVYIYILIAVSGRRARAYIYIYAHRAQRVKNRENIFLAC